MGSQLVAWREQEHGPRSSGAAGGRRPVPQPQLKTLEKAAPLGPSFRSLRMHAGLAGDRRWLALRGARRRWRTESMVRVQEGRLAQGRASGHSQSLPVGPWPGLVLPRRR